MNIENSYPCFQMDAKSDSSQFMNGYISEVVIKMQTLDIVLPLSIIGKYAELVEPFMQLTRSLDSKVVHTAQEKIAPSTFSNLTNLRNDLLPLVYLEFKGCRLMLPASNTARYGLLHDLLMIQVTFYILSNYSPSLQIEWNKFNTVLRQFEMSINNSVRRHQYHTTCG